MYGSDDINFLKLKAYVGSCVFEKLKDLLAGCQLGLDTRQSFISSFCFIWFIKILVCTLLATVAKQTNDCVYTTTVNNNNLNIFKERQHHYFLYFQLFEMKHFVIYIFTKYIFINKYFLLSYDKTI